MVRGPFWERGISIKGFEGGEGNVRLKKTKTPPTPHKKPKTTHPPKPNPPKQKKNPQTPQRRKITSGYLTRLGVHYKGAQKKTTPDRPEMAYYWGFSGREKIRWNY